MMGGVPGAASGAAPLATEQAAEAAQDPGLDPNTSFLLKIKLVCNRKKARNDAKCWVFEKVVDSDLTNFKDLVESVVKEFPPGYLEVPHVQYYDEAAKTFPEIKSDQELMSMFTKHWKIKVVIPAMPDKTQWLKSTHGFFMHPTLLKSVTGRPKTERFKGNNDKRTGGQHQCPICMDYGHHWHNCKKGNPEDISAMKAMRGTPKKRTKKAKEASSSIMPFDNDAPATNMSFPPRSRSGSNQPESTSNEKAKQIDEPVKGKAKKANSKKKKKELCQEPRKLLLDSPSMCTRSKMKPTSPAMSTRSKRRLSIWFLI